MIYMRKALKYLILPFLCAFSFHAGAQAVLIDTAAIPRDRWVHMDGEFVRQLQPRDSILIGDQLEYGFRLENVPDGTVLGFPKLAGVGSVEMVGEDWSETVTAKDGQPGLIDIEASIKIAAFDEGVFDLPPIIIGRATPDGKVDTLFFDPVQIDVKTMPLDTATFQRHPMKEAIQTPFNWDEFIYTIKELAVGFVNILPVLIICKWVIMLIIVGMCIWMIYTRKESGVFVTDASEPAHILALRKLDNFRSNTMWVPEKQKEFYTGVTDALREYISSRYNVSAMEMTTAELFDEIKNIEAFPSEFATQLKELFETADYVKFAKFVAPDEENARAVPMAVRFVTQTYQSELERQQTAVEDGNEPKKK